MANWWTKLVAMVARVWTGTQYADLKSNALGQPEHVPLGSLGLPFKQKSDGTLELSFSGIGSKFRFTRRFWVMTNPGTKVATDPAVLVMTIHRLSDDALMETLTVGAIAVGFKYGESLIYLYTLGTDYYVKYAYNFAGGPAQEQRQRFRYVP